MAEDTWEELPIKAKLLAVFFLLMVLFAIGLIGAAVYHTSSGPLADDLGGLGESCYPNDTCANGLTCYAIRDEKVCEKVIKPVHLSSEKFCFSYKNQDGDKTSCFDTQEDCAVFFSHAINNTSNEILVGCSYEGNFTQESQ